MGLHYCLNYIVTIFVVHGILHCFAFDLICTNFKRPQYSQTLSKNHQYSFSNASEKPELYDKTKSSRHSLHWKWKKAGTDLNNDRNGNTFLTIFKVDTKMQAATTALTKGNYISWISRHVSKPSTPSYIEFDYLDGKQDQQYVNLKRLNRSTEIGITEFYHYNVNKPVRPSIASYHLFNDIRQELITSPKPSFAKNHYKSLFNSYFQPTNNFIMHNLGKTSNKPTVRKSVSNITYLDRDIITEKIYLKYTKVPKTKSETTTTKLLIQFTTPATVSTTPNDRVKFFEIYDNNTLKPPDIKIKINESSEIQSNFTNNHSLNHNTSKLGSCDKISTNKTINEKKHNYKKRSFKEEGNPAVSNQLQEKGVRKSLRSSIQNNTLMFQTENILSKSKIITKTAVVRWASYPFASVYVYKPTQTHCDAAAISPHWLLAAGSCLSRRALVHSLHPRSAFVTYCGDHWRRPERIAYVKRTVVHPKFSPRDKLRKLFYNIGLIQVSNSMAASCPGWSPIALMSHQFSTQPGGSEACAVGWGLDRYGTKHRTEKLPHWPLTLYKALVYYDTCPGSSTYSTAKRDGNDASNVYCLLLPPYTKEESDPVHGGLLLVGGKLVALYLQEERRSRGPQSAQYTGVWRLLPWVMDVAREPDDAEATFDV